LRRRQTLFQWSIINPDGYEVVASEDDEADLTDALAALRPDVTFTLADFPQIVGARPDFLTVAIIAGDCRYVLAVLRAVKILNPDTIVELAEIAERFRWTADRTQDERSKRNA
jgi:hypothetical protein